MSVMTIDASTKRQRHDEDWQIYFFAHEANIVEDNDNDLIVISSIINNFLVERILIDDGSVVEVLIFDTFKKIRLNENLLRPTGVNLWLRQSADKGKKVDNFSSDSQSRR